MRFRALLFNQLQTSLLHYKNSPRCEFETVARDRVQGIKSSIFKEIYFNISDPDEKGQEEGWTKQ
jgi:hypothetical protein